MRHAQRLPRLLGSWLALLATVSFAADNPLAAIERRIVKQPSYESTPQNLMLALGPGARTHVWLVEDGRKLYVDRNANGDLTDDGPPIEPSNVRSLGRVRDSQAERWDFDYLLPEFTPTGGPAQKELQLRRWNYGDSAGDEYGLSLTLDGTIPMYAGWFTSFWAASPERASIVHFGGPLTPHLLRNKNFTPGASLERLSVGFMNDGSGKGATSRLSIDALPVDVVPVVHIRWPTNEGDPPLETTHRLDQRCCYWEFYTVTFRVPKEAVVGTADLTIELPIGSMPLALTTNKIRVPVVENSTDSVPSQ
jgi:hypothetical protein